MSRPIQRDETVFSVREQNSGGFATVNETERFAGNPLSPMTGSKPKRNSESALKPETETSCELPDKEKRLFGKWAEFFIENYSKPPFRTIKTHIANIY
jgi:hypothetical protein